MITHVVLWKFKPDTEKEQEAFVAALKALRGVVNEIKTQEFHRTALPGSEYDLMLVVTFDSLKDLYAYRDDPRHVAAASLCVPIREKRTAFDFES